MGLRDLSDRQRTVLNLVADGKSNRQIGAELFLTEKTVKNYVSQILSVLGVSNRTAAALVWQSRVGLREPTAREAAERAWDDIAEAIKHANPYRDA